MATIIYRRLRAADCDDYRRERLACLASDPDSFGSTIAEQPAGKLRFEQYIETDDDDHFAFGAFADAQLVGIVAFNHETRAKTKHRGEINQMCVDAAYRGQGIGELLLRHIIDAAFTLEGVEQIELGVVSHNTSAIRLYEKLGFRCFGVQPRYFKTVAGYHDSACFQLMKADYVTR